MSPTPLLADLMKPWFDDFAPGSFVAGDLIVGDGEAVEIAAPGTGEALTAYAGAQAEIVARAAEAADAAQRAWAALPGFRRAERMNRFALLIERDLEALARLEAVNVGRPICDARGEVQAAARMIAYYAGWCDKLYGDVIPVPTTHLNYTRREPYGVVLQITPWNAPIVTTCWQIAPALATGNAPLLKPSELTPFSSLALAMLALEAGLPPGLFNVLAGGRETGQAALTDPHVRKAVFVGSPGHGRAIAATAAGRAIPCVLELGGKSANIVFDDADLRRAAVGAQAAIFAASGQSCVAGSRLLVQASVYERFVEAVAGAAARLEIGDPLAETTRIGPIQNARQFEAVARMTEGGIADGARLVGGGGVAERPGFFFRPTVLADVRPKMAIARDEVFGPVLAAMPFRDEDEAVALAADSRFGLAGAVWTGDVGRAHRVAHKVPAGTFWINSYKTIHVMSPFGGFRDSGYGRSSGREALDEYTQVKSIWVETASDPAPAFGYAPVDP